MWISNFKNIKKDKDLKSWIKSYELLSEAIKNPVGKFDLIKDRKRFLWTLIIQFCQEVWTNEMKPYLDKIFKDFYVKKLELNVLLKSHG